MGVRGLTTFIANRSREYFQDYELHDTYLVIDGYSTACQLYKWHSKCNDCFGGDYDKYAQVVYKFFKLLLDCRVTPLVIFDGGYEKIKLKTIYQRLKNRYECARDLNSVNESRKGVFPLFLSTIFVDIVLQLNIKCVKCDFEGDNDTANVARILNCPVLSYDSDFYIFDVLYIPFSTMELNLRRNKDYKYVYCQMYRVEKFLRSFGGMDKGNLPLLAVLLGNDFIQKRMFSAFYNELKMQHRKGNEQQTQIKSVIMWLQKETPESALAKILGRYKMGKRKAIAKLIEKMIQVYHFDSTSLCPYLGIEEKKTTRDVVKMPELEAIPDSEEQDDDSSAEIEDEEDDNEECDFVKRYNKPKSFHDNFRKCLYPSAFVDMIAYNCYYCIAMIEDHAEEHAHGISFNIIAAISGILNGPNVRETNCVSRNTRSQVQKYVIPAYAKELPLLSDIESLDKKRSKEILLEILELDDSFGMFPTNWQIYVFAIKYWITNSKFKIDLSYIYALLLCGIIFNCVDSKIGCYRSSAQFQQKFKNDVTVKRPSKSAKDLKTAMNQIDSNNCIVCMKKLVRYFEMDPRMRSQVKLFDRTIIHRFAEFQSVLLHIKYLNALLNFPFPNFIASDFYNGTFLYNLCTDLQKRGDLKNYMAVLLQSAPVILDVFQGMAKVLEDETVDVISEHEPPRKRRRKRNRKKAEAVPEESNMSSQSGEEEAGVFDANNKFSLLSVIKE